MLHIILYLLYIPLSLALTIKHRKERALNDNMKVAIIGDQGLGANSRKVLHMVKDWKPDFLLNLGDYDYRGTRCLISDDPAAFMSQWQQIMGKRFPFQSVVGNHDILKWFEPGTGYRDLLVKQSKKSGMDRHCFGEYGVNQYCYYNNMIFVFSGVGTMGTKHSEFIHDVFTQHAHVPWKICLWHKNQKKLQTGDKNDETGYKVYETCRKHGAMVLSAHEHSYERTHLLSSFKHQTIVSNSSVLKLQPGHSFTTVCGLGGDSIRPWKDGNELSPWWANNVNYGALLCDFKVKKPPFTAACEFRDVTGKVWDSYSIEAGLDLKPGSFLESLFQKQPTVSVPVTTLQQTVVYPSFIDSLNRSKNGLVDVLKWSVGQSNEITHTLVFDVDVGDVDLITQIYIRLNMQASVEISPPLHVTFSATVSSPASFNVQTSMKTVPLPLLLDTETSDWGSDEAWISPDLSSILKRNMYSGKCRIAFEITGWVDSDNEKEIFGFVGSDGTEENSLLPMLIILKEE